MLRCDGMEEIPYEYELWSIEAGQQAGCITEYRRAVMEWLGCFERIVHGVGTVASLSPRKHETQSMYRAQSVPVGQEWVG